MKKVSYSNSLKQIFDEIVYLNYQNNSTNGVAILNSKKCFIKILHEQSYFAELNGYFKTSDNLPIKKIILTTKIINDYLLVYEYEQSIEENKGLLNDFFAANDNKKIMNFHINAIKKITDIYDASLKNKKILDKSANSIYFEKRINSRLILWYSNNEDFKKKIFYNSNLSKTTSKIILETIQYFQQHRTIECFFSQGDPNTMNIALKPCFFDLEAAGYNSILGETAIIIISTLLYDNYFCPLYHKKSYKFHNLSIKQTHFLCLLLIVL